MTIESMDLSFSPVAELNTAKSMPLYMVLISKKGRFMTYSSVSAGTCPQHPFSTHFGHRSWLQLTQ
jgi:hypothetical protein